MQITTSPTLSGQHFAQGTYTYKGQTFRAIGIGKTPFQAISSILIKFQREISIINSLTK